MKINNTKSILLLSIMISTFFISCTVNYNDTYIKERLDAIEKELDDHEKRISAIEKILENYSQLSEKIDSFNTDYESFKTLVDDVKKDYKDISDKISKTSEVPTSDLTKIEKNISELSDRVTVIENTLTNYNQLVTSIGKISELETNTGNLGKSLSQLKNNYEKDIQQITEDISKLPTTAEIEEINSSITNINGQITTLTEAIDELKEEIEQSPDSYELSVIPNYFTFWKNNQPVKTLKITTKTTFEILYSWKEGKKNCGWSTGQKFDINYLFHYSASSNTSTSEYDYYYNISNGKYYNITTDSYNTIIGTPSESVQNLPKDTKLLDFIQKYIEDNMS